MNLKLRHILYINVLILLALLLTPARSYAQRKPGNEWINYSQYYYKIKVGQTGMYRITYAGLTAAGVPVSQVNPSNLQIFYRGQEVPIYVSSTGSSFTPSDYIEFFGLKNDGAPDTVLYTNPHDHLNRFKSYFSDTSVYFLTWGSAPSSKRIRNYSYIFNGQESFPDYYIEEKLVTFFANYYDGRPVSADIADPEYTVTEGYASPIFNSVPAGFTRDSLAVQFRLPDYVSNVYSPKLDVVIYGKGKIAGASSDDHRMQISIGPANGTRRIVRDFTYSGYSAVTDTIELLNSDINTQQPLAVKFKPKGTVDPKTDNNAVAWVRLRYPRAFTENSLRDTTFWYRDSSGNSNTFFKFYGNGLFSKPHYAVYDYTSGYRSLGQFSNDTVKYAFPADANRDQYFVYDPAKVQSLPLMEVKFTKPDFSTNYNFLIVTHPKLKNIASQYAGYKETKNIDAATKFKTLVVTIDQIYDQFFYGIPSSAALQNFAAYAYDNSPQKPKFMFLLGSIDLVPTFGYPNSDILLTSGIDNHFTGYDSTIQPMIATGRLNVFTEAFALNYLNKLKEYDTSAPAIWHKNVLHISAAEDEASALKYRYFLATAAGIIQGKYIGARVNTVFSSSKSTIATNYGELIQGYVNSGLGLFTYMGHGSAHALAVDIGQVSKLNNRGKYPVMSMNGCSVGYFSTGNSNDRSMSDSFLYAVPGKGAIAWLGHSSTTLDAALSTQVDTLYRLASKELYGRTLGEQYQATVARIQLHSQSDLMTRAGLQIWTYQGDPSVGFKVLPKPDYAVYDSSLSVSPKNVLAKADQFKLLIPILNIGKTSTDSISVRIVHTLPNQKRITYPTVRFKPVSYSDTLKFTILRGTNIIQGQNCFDVYLDPDNKIDEASKKNNHAYFCHLFPGDGARSLFPVDFAIVPSDTPSLTTQSRNVLIRKTGAYFELDTIPTFNSPVKLASGLISGDNLVVWKPKLMIRSGSAPKDSVVYYWRSRLNLPADNGGDWDVVRSFTYIKGSPSGWSQSHIYQFKTITPENMVLDTIRRKFEFQPSFIGVTLTANAYSSSGLGINPDNETGQTYGALGTSKVIFMEWDQYSVKHLWTDQVTGEPFMSHDQRGNVYQVPYRQFNLCDAAERDSFMVAMSHVREGNYVTLVSRPTADFCISSWDASTFDVFHQIGSHLLDNKKDSSVRFAFVMAGRKRADGGILLDESLVYDSTQGAPSGPDVATVKVFLEGHDTAGKFTSALIGPARKWKSMNTQFRSLEDPSWDTTYMSIIGIDKNGQTKLLADYITDSTYDLSAIDAKTYPYLELHAYEKDRDMHTPAQLKLWQVLYDDLPEGSLIADDNYRFYKDTLNQGDTLRFNIAYRNIYKYAMDSMLVRIQIVSGSQVITSIDKRFPPLKPGAAFYITNQFDTRYLNGAYQLVVNVNPNFDQPEMTLDNNILKKEFFVVADRTNPTLDVTFDQKHIYDGEIVRPAPVIHIDVTDDNTMWPVNDTSYIYLSIQRPGSDSAEQLFFSSKELTFIPATHTQRTASVSYKPNLSPGIYTLRAQARDWSGNYAGKDPYTVTFKVMADNAISKLYFYPNPLVNISQFKFYLVGEDLPDLLKIEIYNTTGQWVRSLNVSEMMRLQTGENEISWNGTDGSGHPLPNGMYIFKVVAKVSGKDLQTLEISQDGVSDQTYGRILIIR